MPVKVEKFFGLIVLKSAVETGYPEGVDGLLEKVGFGLADDHFISWASMSARDFDDIEDELKSVGLNCNNEDLECVYVYTQIGKPPKMKRSWFAAEVNESGETWLYRTH